MKTDRYTKAILTVIALALSVIAYNQAAGPGSVAHAAGKFSNVQFSGSPIGFIAVDADSGDVWSYDNTHGQGIDGVTHIGRIAKLGEVPVKDAPVPATK